jgi:hypothetical protein
MCLLTYYAPHMNKRKGRLIMNPTCWTTASCCAPGNLRGKAASCGTVAAVGRLSAAAESKVPRTAPWPRGLARASRGDAGGVMGGAPPLGRHCPTASSAAPAASCYTIKLMTRVTTPCQLGYTLIMSYAMQLDCVQSYGLCGPQGL